MDKKRIIVISCFVVLFIISIIMSLVYYNDKHSVLFETGTDETILTQYVGKNETANKPYEPTKEGYIFKEWQLNGKKYDFNNIVEKDLVLTAKWIKEEYITISFNTNSDYNIKPIKILKGDTIDELPISNKENYEFIGWYLNNNLYSNEEIYSNITLDAYYKNDTINPLYEIGNSVRIIGSYASSSTDLTAYNIKAIGWERKIINIIENSEFPYVIGNENGVTGFFKASSIETIGSE